ncbi:MAG: hydroxyacid dehydrogenase, partial [Desulfobacterota bacterium]|nr:hydroxyacid dehydrogenase [Thermodesulfobacteriota bacterium]
MKIVFLDAATLGGDSDLTPIATLGDLTVYERTEPAETIARLSQARIAITNKVVINRQVMEQLPFLKLICVAATGMNNVDLGYAQER